jgi:hypothetical protein
MAGGNSASDPSAEGTLDELLRVGVFMTDIRRLAEGYVIEKYVLNKRRRILGEEHPDTITAMNNLAITLGDQGQLDEAIALSEVAVQRMKRIHGNEHSHTRIAWSNLARVRAYTTSAQ